MPKNKKTKNVVVAKPKKEKETDYEKVIRTSFEQKKELNRTIEPYSIWVVNDSNSKCSSVDLGDWFVSCNQNIARFKLTNKFKSYLKDELLTSGKGTPDAAAITVAVTTWTKKADDSEFIVLVGSSSLNRNDIGGQVHAENLSTGVVSMALDGVPDVLKDRDLGKIGIKSACFLVYVVDKKGNNFTMCESCKKEVPKRVEEFTGCKGELISLT